MKNLIKIVIWGQAFLTVFFISSFMFRGEVLAAVSNIDKIVFITEPQTVAPDTLSTIISIQTQNSSGISEQIDETSDLLVSVDSPSGQFNSNSTTWNPASTFTMSKNTANKNFYYKDGSSGTFTITAKLTTRITGASWTATQSIVVGSLPVDEAETSTTTATTTDASVATTTIIYSNSTSIIYSTHYIQEALSDYEEPTNIFEVSAGRERLASKDSSVSFVAKHKISKDLESKKCSYLWSFGDGTSASGEKVEHVYKYIGDYNVVLNGSYGDLRSVSRTIIKITLPNLSIVTKSDGSVEIFNQGEYEINLYGWSLRSENQHYSFPQDTIISAGKSVVFPAEYLKISTTGSSIILVDSFGKEGARSDAVKFFNIVSAAELERFTTEYKRLTQLNTYVPTTVSLQNNSIINKIDTGIPLTASVVNTIISTTNLDDQVEDSSSSVSVVIPERGFWSKLFHPIRTIQETFYQ